MSYDLIETSDALGEPFELYRFSYGGGTATQFTYTDNDFVVTHDSHEYAPLAIGRGAIVAAESLDKATLEVTVPEDSGVAELFLVQPPAAVVALTIFRAHWDEDAGTITSPQTIWAGRVLGCAREEYDAKLSCEPVLTSLRRVGLRRHYQYMCPHVLYGAQCRALSGDHLFPATVSAANPRSVTVSGEWDEQFVGGMLAWQPVGKPNERRTILRRHYDTGTQATTFTVAGGVRDLKPGEGIELYHGCRHTLRDCREVFDNAPNFGGMPFIPTQNPHGTTAIYH